MTMLENLLELAEQGVYLDNAASSPLLPEVARTLARIQQAAFANPSATHKFGYTTRRLIERQASDLLQAMAIPPEEAEVIWTSGGTEANNLAIQGTAQAAGQLADWYAVTSATEHASVHQTFQALSARGARIATIPVHPDGSLAKDWLHELVGPETALVSICLVQNETGVVQGLASVRALLAELAPQAALHVDAVQALCKVPIPWTAAKLDLVSVSAHKVHGPGGAGALIVRKGHSLAPQQYGGGQQRGRRSGSLDAMGICSFVEAVRQLSSQQPQLLQRTQTLNRQLREALPTLKDRRGKPLQVTIISPETASPFILAFSLPGYQGAVLSRLLGEAGIIVGTGSACAAESKKPSAVLSAMDCAAEVAYGTLRVSFGAQNTASDVERVVAALGEVLRSY